MKGEILLDEFNRSCGSRKTSEALARGPVTIFIISGLADIDVATNQSMKNTIKYFSEFGYTIHVFAAFPKRYPILQDPEKIFNKSVLFHRSPNFLIPVFHIAKALKDLIGRSESKKNVKGDINANVGYYDEYNFLGRMFYAVFLLFYLPLEAPRVFFYYLKLKPRVFYGVNGPGCALASFLGKLLRKPIIHRWHGSAYTEDDVKKMKTRLRDKLLLLDGGFAKSAPNDAVIMTNDGTRGDKILQLFNVEPRKIHFWMNGLDTADLVPPHGWEPDRFKNLLGLKDRKVIMMASRLVLWKRVDRGIHCIHQLISRYGMDDVVLLLVGHGSERKKLEELAERLEIREAVQFVGAVPHAEIPKYYSIADVFLSLYDVSNLGNPLLEAMYFGLPIVTIDDGSTADLLISGCNALLLLRQSLDKDLPESVRRLFVDPSLRRMLGENAQKTFREKVLSWRDRIFLEHELIQKLLSVKKANAESLGS